MNSELKVHAESNDSLAPRNMGEVMQLADLMAKSDMVPKGYQGKPGNVVVAILAGHPLGLSPFVACQSFAVINGNPSLYGDAMLGVVKASGLLQKITEDCDGTLATCTIVRRGEDPVIRTYNLDDAKKAGLLGKQGPWQQHPARMLQMRARAFALRDVFPDILRGLGVAEEQEDMVRAEKAVVVSKPARLGADAVKAALMVTADSEPEPPEQLETPQEEPQQTPEPTREEIFLVTWRGEMSGLRDKQASEITASLKSAWEAKDREAVEKIALEQIPEVTHTRNRDKLERFANAIGDYLTYQQEVQG